MEHKFKYKGNNLHVVSSAPREESRELAAHIFKALRSVAGLQGKEYTLELEVEEPEAKEPAEKAAEVAAAEQE